MKRIISTIIILSFLVGAISIPSLAAPSVPSKAELAKNAADYAYMDIDVASPEMKEAILEARNIIIYSSSWVADGHEGGLVYPDGTYEELPAFSELFPEWELLLPSTAIASNSELNTAYASSEITYFYGTTYISTPPAYSYGPAFYSFTARSLLLHAGAISIPGSSYNIGLLMGSYTPIMYASNLKAGIGISASVGVGVSYSLHASTNSTSGMATMVVEGQ